MIPSITLLQWLSELSRNMSFGLTHFVRWPPESMSSAKPQPCLSLVSAPCLPIAAAAAKSLQLCLMLCDPIDSSPPGSSVPGILRARILEWVAISFSNLCLLELNKYCMSKWRGEWMNEWILSSGILVWFSDPIPWPQLHLVPCHWGK